jgi:hypothetical protein
MALSLEDMMATAFSMEETITLSVQNTVGQITHVRVRASDPTSLFPKQVADQVGYNSRIVGKLRFYLPYQGDDDEAPLALWRSIQFSHKTWKEVLPPTSSLLLTMEIEDDSEEERLQKLALLRTVLLERGCYEVEQLDDLVLWSRYLQWFLYARSIQEWNRYQMMVAFAEHWMECEDSSMEM